MRFVALVTGASSGIGEQLALTWAKTRSSNLVLILAARREARLKLLATRCHALHPQIVTCIVPCDLSVQPECERLIRTVQSEYQRLDRLYLNAGKLQRCRVEEMELKDAADMMNINFWSSVWLTHTSLPLLKSSNGKIIVVNSLFGKIPVPQHALYSASKHALRGFFYALAREQEHFRSQSLPYVGVSSVFPGAVETEITHNMVGPHGSRLKIELTKENVPSLLSAEEAASVIIQAGEEGVLEHVFPERERKWALKSYGSEQDQREIDGMFSHLLFPKRVSRL